MMDKDSGRSPLRGSGSQASPGAADASPPSVSIPNAGTLLAVADDLIALAAYVYDDNANFDDPSIEDASCDAEGVCWWGVCRESGCIIDKYHRGLALQTALLASAMSAGTAETAQQAQGQRPASAVPEGETP